eukprot:1605371-Pleurochrysis_carterae.AAC.1
MAGPVVECRRRRLDWPRGGASRWDGESAKCPEGRHGKNVSSKYTSEACTTLRVAGIQML